MKKTIAITSALAAASSLATAEIKINEFLSVAGFVDMSYSHTDTDSDSDGKDSDNNFSIDQVEIDWMFNFGKVTGQIDIEYEGRQVQTVSDNFPTETGSGDGVVIEQAFVSYDLGNGAALTMGRYESMLGLEAKEPTGLYQFSTAYDGNAFLPQYGQGVKYTGQSGDISYGVSLQDESFGNGSDRLGGNQDVDGSYSVEAVVALTSGNFTYSLGGAFEDADDQGDNSIINAHVTYVSGAWTLGAEYNVADIESDDNAEVDSWLVMANYAYSDCCSVTARISGIDANDDGSNPSDSIDGLEALKYTLAHNYALSDNLAIITEVSLSEFEQNGSDEDDLTGAVEVLFTF
jgi:hypothetical protein